MTRPNTFDPTQPAGTSSPRDGDNEMREIKAFTQNGWNDLTSTDRVAVGRQTQPIFATNITATSFAGDITGDVTGDTSGTHTGATNGAHNGTVGATTPAVGSFTSLDATSLSGPLTGDVTGALTGNADTATALSTAQNFSITGDITAPAISFDGGAAVAFATTLGSNTVSTDNIVNANVTNAKLANSSITVGDGTNSSAISLGGSFSISGTTGEVDVVESSGAFTVSLPNALVAPGSLTVTGDLTVQGDTHTTNVDTYVVADPIVTYGGTAALTTNDGMDRGVAFRYYDTQDRFGFFGWDRSIDMFTFIPEATISGEVVSGTVGTAAMNLMGNVTGDVTGDVTGATTGAHNGSVGATTPSTGAFTTITGTSFTGAVIGATTGAHNGTVGATTPAAGDFTDLSTTGTVTIGDYLFTVSSAGHITVSTGGTNLFRIDDSGNILAAGNVTANATIS